MLLKAGDKIMEVVDVVAPTAGSIIQIVVDIGQSVDKQQTLVVIESMKMEIPVASPTDGHIVEVLVKVGDPVENGDVLARVRAR